MSQIDHQTRIAIADWVKRSTRDVARFANPDMEVTKAREEADRFAATGLIPGHHPDPSLTKRAA